MKLTPVYLSTSTGRLPTVRIDCKPFGPQADRSELEQRMRDSAVSVAALPPLGRAKLVLAQACSFVRGMRSEETSAEAVDARLNTYPEYVVLDALEAAEARIGELQADNERLRDECESHLVGGTVEIANYFDLGREFGVPPGRSPFEGIMMWKRQAEVRVTSLERQLAEARSAGMRDAAEIARSHKGKAKAAWPKTIRAPFDVPEALAEIRAEERGEDIAAEMIADAILAAAEAQGKEGE